MDAFKNCWITIPIVQLIHCNETWPGHTFDLKKQLQWSKLSVYKHKMVKILNSKEEFQFLCLEKTILFSGC
jgi:hypothetical protein